MTITCGPMKKLWLVLIAILILPNLVLGFVAPFPKALVSSEKQNQWFTSCAPGPNDCHVKLETNVSTNGVTGIFTLIPAIVVLTTSLPAEAAAGAVPSALWAYAHFLSIIVIFGCLSAERTIVKAGMTEEEEKTIVKLDLLYGVMAVLL
jgi:Predicted membrane protein (DUF2214)